jgi:hypothetical protein
MATTQELLSKFRANNYKSSLDLNVVPSALEEEAEPTPTTGLEKTASGLDTVFGFGKVGEAIGTQIAKSGFAGKVGGVDLTPEQAQFVSGGPTTTEVVGSAVQGGALFTPVGRIANVISRAIRPFLGLTKIAPGTTPATTKGFKEGVARLAGPVGASGGTGAVFDVSQVLQGEDVTFPTGTFIGSSIPLVGPLARATTRLTGRFAGEVGGTLTGTSQETFEQAFNAARRGDPVELKKFTDALRSETTPEQLVNSVRESIEAVSNNRQLIFKETLEEFGDDIVDTTGVIPQFTQKLDDFGVAVKNGVLDFSNSSLRTVPPAQAKLQKAYDEVAQFGPQATLKEVDTSRQALRTLLSAGDDPSANKANALIEVATDSVRQAGRQVDEYGPLLEQFAETSTFLDELQRGLSAGDRATIDQTYKRIVTSLKTNNEQRMALVQELDQMTDGALLSQVSGQQLSELFPRGLFKQLGAAAVGGAALVGGVSQALLPALVFASPRISGEVIRAIGLTAKQTDVLASTINSARRTLSQVYGVAPENLIKAVTATGIATPEEGI